MSLHIIILIIVCMITTILEYLVNKRLFTPSVVLGWPYVVVILLNNTIGIKMGFYSVSASTVQTITLGILVFSFGSLIGGGLKKVLNFQHSKYKDSLVNVEYDIKRIIVFVYIVIIVNFIRLFYYFYIYGVDYFISTDGLDGIMMSGLFCHFILACYCLVPIIVNYAIVKRKIIYIIPVILMLTLIYFTFVKYHLISFILIIIIYLNVNNPKLFYRTIPFMVGIPIAVFFANYITIFNARGDSFQEGYLIKHFLNYISGGIIYDSVNPFYTYNSYGIIEILMMMIMAVPNLFIKLIFGVSFFEFEPIPFLPMGNNGERGNVLNTISFLFSSNNYMGTSIVLFIIGFIVAIIYSNRLRRLPTVSVIYAFIFLSFYATFLVLAPPWEMLIFSLIVPRFFIKKYREGI